MHTYLVTVTRTTVEKAYHRIEASNIDRAEQFVLATIRTNNAEINWCEHDRAVSIIARANPEGYPPDEPSL